MGKEAKIGVVLIMGLLIVLGVVLARNVWKPSGDSEAVASSKKDKSTTSKSKDKEPSTNSRRMTVLSQGDSNTRSAPPAMTGWGSPSEGSESDDATNSDPSQTSGRALLPSANDWSNTQDYSTTEPQPESEGTSNWDVAQSGDPYQQNMESTSDGDGYDSATQRNALKVISPPESSASGDSRYADSGQYSARNSYSGQTSPYQNNYRSPYSTSARTASSPGSTGSYSSNPYSSNRSTYGSGTLSDNDGQYKVQPNDSYWVISKKLYGTGGYFKALAEHNLKEFPKEDRLQVGDLISTPKVEALERTYPGLCPKASRRQAARGQASVRSASSSYHSGRTYTVEEGDTLFDIARFELGKASRWAEIYELNRDLLGEDCDFLAPGMKLALPEEASQDPITRKPDADSPYQR